MLPVTVKCPVNKFDKCDLVIKEHFQIRKNQFRIPEAQMFVYG